MSPVWAVPGVFVPTYSPPTPPTPEPALPVRRRGLRRRSRAACGAAGVVVPPESPPLAPPAPWRPRPPEPTLPPVPLLPPSLEEPPAPSMVAVPAHPTPPTNKAVIEKNDRMGSFAWVSLRGYCRIDGRVVIPKGHFLTARPPPPDSGIPPDGWNRRLTLSVPGRGFVRSRTIFFSPLRRDVIAGSRRIDTASRHRNQQQHPTGVIVHPASWESVCTRCRAGTVEDMRTHTQFLRGGSRAGASMKGRTR